MRKPTAISIPAQIGHLVLQSHYYPLAQSETGVLDIRVVIWVGRQLVSGGLSQPDSK